jgi:hypothetical protein
MLVNLCGDHLVRLQREDGRILELEYVGVCARVNFTQKRVASIDGVPIYKNCIGKISGLPEPQEGVVYVTSRLLAAEARRLDVCCPNSAPWHVKARGGDGKPLMVDSLITYGGDGCE